MAKNWNCSSSFSFFFFFFFSQSSAWTREMLTMGQPPKVLKFSEDVHVAASFERNASLRAGISRSQSTSIPVGRHFVENDVSAWYQTCCYGNQIWFACIIELVDRNFQVIKDFIKIHTSYQCFFRHHISCKKKNTNKNIKRFLKKSSRCRDVTGSQSMQTSQRPPLLNCNAFSCHTHMEQQ